MKNLTIMAENELLTPLSDHLPRGRQKQFPISVILVCCAALFLRPTASLADGSIFTTNSDGSSYGNVSVTNASGTGPSGGAFSAVYASAKDSHGTDAVASLPPPPVNYPGIYDTTTQTSTGDYFVAKSDAKATAAVNAKITGYNWSAVANPFQIKKIDNAAATAENASVVWRVTDPVTYPGNPGDQIMVSFTPTSSLGMIFPNANPNELYSSTFSAFAQTDIPGLSSLFSLSIQMSSATPGNVGVNFTSNPLLGLNDAAIAAELDSGFHYDSTTGNYSFDPTGQTISATFTEPAGLSSVNVTSGMGGELDASVPEPATVGLILAGIALLLRGRRLA